MTHGQDLDFAPETLGIVDPRQVRDVVIDEARIAGDEEDEGFRLGPLRAWPVESVRREERGVQGQ